MASVLKKKSLLCIKTYMYFSEQLLKCSSRFNLPLLLCCLLYQGVSGIGAEVSEVSVKEGSSVSFDTGVKTNQQDRIRWFCNHTRIAQINRDFNKICTDVQCNAGTERFRDRLKLDHQTGSLTIVNLRTTDSGVYKVQISGGNHSNSEKTYSVNVYATTTDYRDYYDQNDEEFASPCNNGSMKASSKVLLPSLYSTVFILGFTGNVTVMWVLIRYRQKTNMTDVCLFNLALSDLLFLVSLPFWAHSAMNKWVFGEVMCHAMTGLFMMGLYGSIFFMVLMSVDRYIIIVHAYSNFSRKMRLVLALLVWILSLFASLPNIIFAKEKMRSKSCGLDFPEGSAWMSFTYLKMNFLSLIFPLIIMGFCYCRIIPTLLSIKSQKRQKKVIRLILAVVAVYFLFWTPYNIVMFLKFLQRKGRLLSCEWHFNLNLAMQWVETIALSHCCLNPIIYGFAGHFKRAEVLKKISSEKKNSQCTSLSPQLSECRKSTEYSSA